jgi:hypothetical protein
LLAKLERPVVLSRNAERAAESLARYNVTAHKWDSMHEPAPAAAFEGVDAVFHLAGEPVAEGRWTAEKKRLILDSRVLGTRNLVETLRKLERKPSVLVSTSAVGWYGSRGDELLDETALPADDFLAEVCVAWEREAREAAEFGVRVVCIRTGVVLGPDGGALKKLLTPFRLGLGGRLGNGKQWMPWIHVEDLASLYVYAAEHADLAGPANGVSPNPVTNRQFTKDLAAVLHRPALFPVPFFALRTLMGEFAQVLFDSQRAVPKAAVASGFQFRFPTLPTALKAIV